MCVFSLCKCFACVCVCLQVCVDEGQGVNVKLGQSVELRSNEWGDAGRGPVS